KGMHDNDVIELQKRLVAEGFFTIDSPTDYFGPLTFVAVKSYQAAHTIEQVGIVGPKTRSALNGDSVVSDATKEALIASLQAQLKMLLDKIHAFMASSTQI